MARTTRAGKRSTAKPSAPIHPKKTAAKNSASAGRQRREREEIESAYPEVTENPYGDWLREALNGADMTVWTLSEASGVSAPQIYNILAGRSRNPQQNTRTKLESVLGSSPAVKSDEEDSISPNMGELTDFDPHNEALLPNCRGVYVFYDITDRPVYVGRASTGERTIRARVKEHHEKFWFKRPIVNNGAFIEIQDETLCISVERALIKFLKTNAVLNKQHVDRD